MTKLFAATALVISFGAIAASYTQPSALILRQETQPYYWPRHGTDLSGRYQGSIWVPLPSRTAYSSFRGGGPSTGK